MMVGEEIEEYHPGLFNSSSSDRITAGYQQLLMGTDLLLLSCMPLLLSELLGNKKDIP